MMLAESVRQGQAETENRLVMMKAMQGSMGGTGENPLNEFFANDKEVMRLDIDLSKTKELIKNSYFSSPFCFHHASGPTASYCAFPARCSPSGGWLIRLRKLTGSFSENAVLCSKRTLTLQLCVPRRRP